MRILMILIPDDEAAAPAREPVLRLERFIGPYYAFRDAGAEVVLASPSGGFPWMGPAEGDRGVSSPALDRFRADRPAREDLTDTLDLGQVYDEDFDAALCLGAPRPPRAGALIAAFLGAGKPVVVIPSTPGLVAQGTGGGLIITGDDAAASLRAANALLGALKG
jgi:putative intracellular protease/amidase